jgi:hypothetical protein
LRGSPIDPHKLRATQKRRARSASLDKRSVDQLMTDAGDTAERSEVCGDENSLKNHGMYCNTNEPKPYPAA